MASSSLVILIFIVGFSRAHSDPCLPVCAGNSCVIVHESRVDFPTAEERCRSNNGELLTAQTPDDERLFSMVSGRLRGEFWIGLRLPEHACSSTSDPLRGYEWIHKQRNFIPAAATWKDKVEVCSPRCVAMSREQVLIERVCSEQSDGFLCRTLYKDACNAHKVSELKVFKSKKGCSNAPCEHICTKVADGFTCSCEKGYTPDRKDPRRCKVHCDQKMCLPMCDGHPPQCSCADGYILGEKFCEDIDECFMNQCSQLCHNTPGSFICSCKEGFVLKGEVECVKSQETAKPEDQILKTSSLSSVGFIWLWVLLAVAVIVVICLARYFIVKRQKHRDINLRQMAPPDNMAN